MDIRSVFINGDQFIDVDEVDFIVDENISRVYSNYQRAIEESVATLRKTFDHNFLLKELKMSNCVDVYGIELQLNSMACDQDLDDVEGLVESLFSLDNMTSGILVDLKVAIEAHRDLLPNAALVRQEEYAAALLRDKVYEVDELGGKYALIDYTWFSERFSISWDEFMNRYVNCSEKCKEFYEMNKTYIYKAHLSVDTAMIYQESNPYVNIAQRMTAYLSLHLLAGDSVYLLNPVK